MGEGVHGGRADPGETADGRDRGDEGEPEHVEVVSAGLLETLGGVHETGGDVLVHVQEDRARGGGRESRELHPAGDSHDVGHPGARDGGREGGGEGQGLEGEAVVARDPRGEDAADADGEGGREVTDEVADALGAVGGALEVGDGERGAEGDERGERGAHGEGGGDGGVEEHHDDLLGGLDAEDARDEGGEGLVGELGEEADEVGGGGHRDAHEDDGGPDADPRVGAEEGEAVLGAGGVEDRGVGHDGTGGREDGHGLTAQHRVQDATDGGREDHLGRAEHAGGGGGEHGTEGDGGREGREEEEEDGSLGREGRRHGLETVFKNSKTVLWITRVKGAIGNGGRGVGPGDGAQPRASPVASPHDDTRRESDCRRTESAGSGARARPRFHARAIND